MKTVAERVGDRAMLALVKRFLEASIVDERDGGRPRRPRQGTPQGGVISPLMANVYLHLLDRNFRRRTQRGDLHGRLVRYADDFVLLSPHRPDRALAWLQQLMPRLGLTLHPAKTRVLDVRHEDFVFLGHTHRWLFNRLYLNVSPKALRRIRDELRRKTRQTWLSLDAMIADLNPYIRGARHYFPRVRRRTLYHLDGFVNQRLARWWWLELSWKKQPTAEFLAAVSNVLCAYCMQNVHTYQDWEGLLKDAGVKQLETTPFSLKTGGVLGMLDDEGFINAGRIMFRYMTNARIRKRMNTMNAFFKNHTDYFGYGIYTGRK